ncbi:MAG: hypothetical protein S4CHLAM6_11990 [Chlamydiae bacterium]|nr:hypothetical protein [Chlamydiota bacterium]
MSTTIHPNLRGSAEFERRDCLSNMAKGTQQDFEMSNLVPSLLSASKQYAVDVVKHFPKTAVLTATMVTAGFFSGQIKVYPVHTFVGLCTGTLTSHMVRNISHAPATDHNIYELQGLKKVVESPPFIGAMATTALLGSLAFSSSILYSAPVLLAGVAVHCVADFGQKKGVISDDEKSLIQTVSAVVTSTMSLINPISSLISLGLGASMGAVLEEQHAQSNKEAI